MKLALLFCICTFAYANHNHANRRRNMLDLNRTPRRESDSLFDPIEGLGTSTCDLRGNWYNQHGSELIFNQTEDGKLIGEFRTSVRLSISDTQQAVSNSAPVRGEIFGRMFTFHVYWTEKKALTTWSGQCQRGCDFGWFKSDRDILHAPWIITSNIAQCDDYWTASRIGEDIFTRLPLKAGPRRGDELNARTE